MRNNKEILDRYLIRNSKRRTPERYAILSTVEDLGGMFSPQDILAHVTQKDGCERMSLVTVYNNLNLFRDLGILRERAFKGRSVVYEVVNKRGGLSASPFLVCRQCGRVRKLHDLEPLKELRKLHFPDFDAESYELNIYGLCTSCQRRNKKEQANVENSNND